MSGDKEYDSRAEHDTVVPVPAMLNVTGSTQFGSYFPLVSQSHHQTSNPNPSLFDPSPYKYVHTLSQSQPAASVPNSEPSCTDLLDLPSSSSFLLAGHQSLGGCSSEASLCQQSGSVQENDNGRVWAPTSNAVRNSKKRSRASRRAPTTVLTTDTSNFRSMVQEFTGIPAPPFSASSYSRLFNPVRPSPRTLHPSNPSLPSSSSLATTMVDAIAPPTNITSSTATTKSPASHQLLPDLGFAFHTPLLHPFTVPFPAGFSSKSQPSGSGYEPCSTESSFSEWAINTTNSWPSHF